MAKPIQRLNEVLLFIRQSHPDNEEFLFHAPGLLSGATSGVRSAVVNDQPAQLKDALVRCMAVCWLWLEALDPAPPPPTWNGMLTAEERAEISGAKLPNGFMPSGDGKERK